MSARSVRFLVLSDEPHPCAYLPGETARLPLRLPLEAITPGLLDVLLARGDRRAGTCFYRPTCASCEACEGLRLPIARFAPTASQRRVYRRNEGVLEVEVVPPQITERHVEIYNRHKAERGLARDDDELGVASFAEYYVHSGVDTREVRYSLGGRLVAFSIVDVGRRGVSSVYHCFDPEESRRSLGVYSVLKEVELFSESGHEWYYLGLWVEACAALAYKAGYFPHQRRVRGVWHEFAAPGAPGVRVGGDGGR